MTDVSKNHFLPHISKRKFILICLFFTIIAGFSCKFYSGPGCYWFNNYGAGMLYEVFWCLLVFVFFPKRRFAVRIAVCIFIITCILETLQLWHPPLLELIRSTLLGAAILGTTFVWWDFPYYILGCLLGWFWMKALSITE